MALLCFCLCVAVLSATPVFGVEERICLSPPDDPTNYVCNNNIDIPKERLPASEIEKFVADLLIPPVLHDDKGYYSHVEISLRQIEQQVLPPEHPKTTQWAYGLPHDPLSYLNPSGTFEVTQNVRTRVTWINELVEDPDTCRCDHTDEIACRFLPHIIQDACGTPLIDQTLHWANPAKDCADEELHKTDCRGNSSAPYWGPVPMTVHLHGAHVESESDGYPESWYLPKAIDIPDHFETTGSLYIENDADLAYNGYTKGCENQQKGKYGDQYHDKFNPGRHTNTYTNDQPTTTLFYHDHGMGCTRLTVYAAAAGFWNIRQNDDGESGLIDGILPGPPAIYGEDPNDDKNRKKIREIGLAIQPKSFYEDGSLWYPANRQYFDGFGDGVIYGSNCQLNVPFLPDTTSDVPPIWNPEAFFDTIVVNGQTWPKLKVAQERYRLRIVNAADSRFLNLALFANFGTAEAFEIPFFVIGSDHGMLPYVTNVTTGAVTQLNFNGPPSNYTPNDLQALLMAPAERYDVIVDFTDVANGTEVTMINTGPDGPFTGFDDEEPFVPADADTTGCVMKFCVDESYNNTLGDQSTPVDKLVLNHMSPAGCDRPVSVDNTRNMLLHEELSDTTGFVGPVAALLGTSETNGMPPAMPSPRLWRDEIVVVPDHNSVESWYIDNDTADAHPIHLHLVKFEVLCRGTNHTTCVRDAVAPFEEGWKDTVIAYPGEVTKIRMLFDIEGLYVWHCHILSHEDNEMMLPFCVGQCHKDPPVPPASCHAPLIVNVICGDSGSDGHSGSDSYSHSGGGDIHKKRISEGY